VSARLELLVERAQGRVRLLAPDVGRFTGALPRGAALVAGQEAGALITLGRPTVLVVPADAAGEIVSDPPERVQAPVGYGDVVYELAPVSGASRAAAARESARDGGALVLRAPQAGRFYLRPAPGEPPFVTAGAEVRDGQPVGLIEVMKTFGHVHYRAAGGLPAHARVKRLIAADAADVKQGDPLLEVEAV